MFGMKHIAGIGWPLAKANEATTYTDISNAAAQTVGSATNIPSNIDRKDRGLLYSQK